MKPYDGFFKKTRREDDTMDSKEFVEKYKEDSKAVRESLETLDKSHKETNEALGKITELLESHHKELAKHSEQLSDLKGEDKGDPDHAGDPAEDTSSPSGKPKETDTKDDTGKQRQVEAGDEPLEQKRDRLQQELEAVEAKMREQEEEDEEEEEQSPEAPAEPKMEKHKTKGVSKKKGVKEVSLREMSGKKMNKLLKEHFSSDEDDE